MHSRNQWLGYIILFVGISIFLSMVGLDMFVGPLLFVCLGLFFLRGKNNFISLIFFALALITLFQSVFHVNVGGLLVAFIFIYFGLRMVTGRGMPDWFHRRRMRRNRRNRFEKQKKRERKKAEKEARKEEDWLDDEIEKLHREHKKKTEESKPKKDPEDFTSNSEFTFKTPRFRNSLIGDFHLLDNRFELDDMNISYGIGDVKIDLSKAIIPEGESSIVISGFIGDVDIYVPYDLDVSVNASATFGELKVLGYKQGGVNRQIGLSTKGYDEAASKVKISISTFIGDVEVRYL